MTRLRRLVLAFAGSAALVAPLAVASPASAAIAVSLSRQISLSDGDAIEVRLAGVPATQGVYIQQCYRPEIGQRSITGLKCNGSLQDTDVMIWASMDGARGSQSAAAPLTFTVRDSVTSGGTTYRCGAWDCFLFVYRDHRGITDRSLDTIVPLVFLVEQQVKTRSFGMAKDGASVRLGGSMTLQTESMVSEQGVDVRVRSTTPAVCTVSRGASTTTIRFISRGSCVVNVLAKGDAVFKRYSQKFTYTVG